MPLPKPPSITSAPPPWELKATVYAFLTYTSSSSAKTLSSQKKSFLYSPLEANSSFSDGEFQGGLGMVQVLRYSESPVGPYDELLIVPGKFGYEVEEEGRDGERKWVRRSSMKVTRIYVSQEETCWNGRMNWNIPKHLAHFTFTSLPNDGGISISVFPSSTSPSTSPSTPFFSATYKPIPFLPNLPISTTILPYIGLDAHLVQPPLPAGKGTLGELPGTEMWCKVLPYMYSRKTSVGWWDLRQVDEGGEERGNFWPGGGRWRLGVRMEDAVIRFDAGMHWEGRKA